MVKYKPSRDLPRFARELNTLSPTKLSEYILMRMNIKVEPDAIRMWFTRNPKIRDELEKEIITGVPTVKEEVTTAMFEKKAFEELPSVKEWILFMKTRRVKGKPLHPEYIKEQIRLLRHALREHSVPKHPDRLTFRDAQEIFVEIEDKGHDSYAFRRAIKDFLKARGVAGWEKIGVGKPTGYGKYKTLFVDKETVHKMLDYIKGKDFEVYVVDSLMYYNGLRIQAVLDAKIEDFKRQPDKWATLTVTEKFRTRLTFDVVPEVADLVETVVGDRTKGKIFKDVTERRVNILNREALKVFLPELEPQIEMPSHFFRHACAQNLKRMVGSHKAAAIMKTSLQSFIESYGGDTEEEVSYWTRETLPKLDPDYLKRRGL